MRTAREIVEAIQRDRGLDVSGGSISSSAGPVSRNHRDLGNALKLLSDQLYNSDGHFLLELIQNADDNLYPEGTEPTVIIEAGRAELVFRNNESGFSEANVEAVCSIGESTKTDRKATAIGEK